MQDAQTAQAYKIPVEVAALRTLYPDPSSVHLCLTVPARWLTGLVACVAGRGRWAPWELDHVTVRREEEAKANVTLRFASEGEEPLEGSHRQALMGVVMAVLEHLRERTQREHETEDGKEEES